MPSPFDALDATLSGVVMDAFGESEDAILLPRRVSQYAGPLYDPDRPVRTVRGIFSLGSGETPIRGNSPGEFAGTLRLASDKPEFWLPAAQVAAIPYRIAVRDLMEFPGRAGQPTYAIARIQWSDVGDANLILTTEDQDED